MSTEQRKVSVTTHNFTVYVICTALDTECAYDWINNNNNNNNNNVRLLQLQSERYNKRTSVTQDSIDTIERKASIYNQT